jgi:selenide,water dikinase
VLSKLPQVTHENLLVGTNTADDAGVYKLTDDIAIIQTIDVFTPVVDNPYDYGQIVAANSISDVYAMGGKPLTALNFIGYPKKELPLEVMSEILLGGQDKAAEAETIIVGGHSIIDPELKYGMAVTGIIHPDKILTNAAAKPGDKLFLTKPIGTGILSTALKAGNADSTVEKTITGIMAELNKTAAELMIKFNANSCTDITGYGLMGHAYEMASGSGVGFRIYYNNVPIIPGTLDYCKKGNIPGGSWNNKSYLQDKVEIKCSLSEEEELILYDAQTSGGLLISVPAESSADFEQALKDSGVVNASVIGEVTESSSGLITIEN